MSNQSEKQFIDFSIEAAIFVSILTVYVMLSYLIEMKNVKYIHQSTVAIFMGILTAIFSKYALQQTISFSNQIFFAIILPPIIFSAGFSLRKNMFFQNFGLICFFGIIGTILGFICITLILILLNKLFFHSLSLPEMMVVASVLCATDTVAAGALIKPQKYPILSAVLFGESIINDAVSIILYGAVSQIGSTKDEQFGYQMILKMSLSFLYLFFFSMLLGIISGLLLSYLLRKFSFFSKYPIKQTSIVLLNGYFTYLLGEIFQLSGIITLFTQSIIIGHYAFMNLSQESKKGTGMAFQTVSYIAEGFVYTYLGASILSVSQNWIAVVMALVLLLFLPLVRALMVYILPCFYRILGKKFHMKPKQLKVCWFAGMIRGVITFALCLQNQSENKQFILSLVLVIVLATTVGGSSFLNKFIQIIKLSPGSLTEELEHLNQKMNQGKQEISDLPPAKDEDEDTNKNRWKIVVKLIAFQRKYMRPFFGKVSETDLNLNQDKHFNEEKRYNQMSNQNNLNVNTNKINGVELQILSPTKKENIELENIEFVNIEQAKIEEQNVEESNIRDWKPFQQRNQ